MSTQERWQLSGNAPESYERYVRLIMEPWVQRLVDVASPASISQRFRSPNKSLGSRAIDGLRS